MRYLFFSLIISLLLGASICCAPPTPKTPSQRGMEFVNSIQEKTVALIKKNKEGEIFTFCGGVWVARDLILTAHHCLREDSFIVFYRQQKDSNIEIRIAAPKKFDKLNDLILLKAVDGTIPIHPYADIAKNEWVGQPVHIMGHPNGLSWSYFQGTISSRRKIFDKDLDGYQRLLQISAPIWKGNSGGGAFDQDGNLVGICSWITLDAPMVGFFIHREPILEFLKGEI